MTTIADQYRENAAQFTSRVEAVPEDRWDDQSPCPEWKARDVVRHAVDVSSRFLGFVGEKLPPGPSVDDDPLGAWESARDAMQAALEDPNIATKEYDGMWGKASFEQGVARFAGPDLFVHSWDLARATGGDESMDPAQAEAMLEALKPMDDKMRAPGAFGPKIDPPQADDPKTRLLNFLGRRV